MASNDNNYNMVMVLSTLKILSKSSKYDLIRVFYIFSVCILERPGGVAVQPYAYCHTHLPQAERHALATGICVADGLPLRQNTAYLSRASVYFRDLFR